jgi:hypothetical protein
VKDAQKAAPEAPATAPAPGAAAISPKAAAPQDHAATAEAKTKAATAAPAEKAKTPAAQLEPKPAIQEQAAVPAKAAQISTPAAAPRTSADAPAAAHTPAAPHAPAPAPAAARTDALAYDPSLRMTMKPGEAHVSLDAGGGVSLHVQVQNGVANVRAEGAAAPLLSQNLPELRASLASSGLSLGGFESGDSPRREQPESDTADAPTPAGKPIANPVRRSSKSRLEVEA